MPYHSEEFMLVGKLAYSKGLTAGTGGNMSVFIPEENKVIITRTGAFLGGLIEPDLVEVTPDGSVLKGKQPSSELPLHLAIYQGTVYRACLHLHSPYAIVLSEKLDSFTPPTLEGAKMLGIVRVLPQFTATVEDVKAVVHALSFSPIVILQNHGVLSAGSDLFECYILLETLELNCQIAVLRHLLS